MENVNLKRKVTLKRKGDAHDQTPEGKKPNKFIWLAVIGLVVIGGIFGLKQLNQENPVELGAEEVVVTEDINTNPDAAEPELVTTNEEDTNSTADNTTSEQNDVSAETESVTNSTTSVENNVTSNPKSTEDANVTKDAASNDKSKSNGKPIQSGTVSVQGSLEEKVKQVIRGDFGNGKDRTQALGAEYAAIQAKVNEMYRNGIN